MTHYIEFIVTDKHAPIGHCVSKLMTMLHGLMRKTQTNLGVSFPAMSEDFIGDKVRVFGTLEQLMIVLANPQIQDACRRSVCSLSVYIPTLVPPNSERVCYQAARDQGHNIMSIFKRKLARFEKRHSEPMPSADQKKLKLHLANKSRDLPYFLIKGEDKTYSLYITKQISSTHGEFNSHGLGNSGGSVYDF